MSTYAVENLVSLPTSGRGAASFQKEGKTMRIMESATAGLLALAAQVLVVATVLI
jgi:hypothetical protein